MDFSLNRSFVLSLLMKYITHYGVRKVIRKRTEINHNHPNCFTNDTKYISPKLTMNTLN